MPSFSRLRILLLLALPAGFMPQAGAQQLQAPKPAPSRTLAPAEALRRVPVLSYHQVRDRNPADSRTAATYIIPVQTFREHIRLLKESGYQAILPGALLAYAFTGAPLPPKPVLITFDDGTESQYRTALPILDRAGFKACFFLMTVSLNKPRYMSNAMVKDLAARGQVIGCHTWDHQDVTRYGPADWVRQLDGPVRSLEALTGSRILYFAYPFGAWNEPAVQVLKQRGIQAAFQLWGRTADREPQLNIRRILVDGNWSASRLLQEIRIRYP